MEQIQFVETLNKRIFTEDYVFLLLLRNKGIIAMIAIMKILAIYILFFTTASGAFTITINLLMFFYWELIILFRYFRVEKKVAATIGYPLQAKVTISEDEIIHEYTSTTNTHKWAGISFVKETRRHFVFYNGKSRIISFNKKSLNEKAINDLYHVLQYKKNSGLDVHFDWSKKK